MKLFLLTITTVMLTAIGNLAVGQSYSSYINSFTKVDKGGTIAFGKIIQNQNQMSREEALKFVYGGDTSRLFCVSQNINMITEQKGSLMRSLRLPSKCMVLKMDDYTLISYTSFDCGDPKKTQVAYLHLKVLNKTLNPIDSLVVYRESFEFPDILGELNSKNGFVFLVGYLKTKELDPSDQTRKIYAQMLTIDKKTLRFKRLKESAEVKGNYTNLPKTLKALGWEEIFNGN